MECNTPSISSPVPLSNKRGIVYQSSEQIECMVLHVSNCFNFYSYVISSDVVLHLLFCDKCISETLQNPLWFLVGCCTLMHQRRTLLLRNSEMVQLRISLSITVQLSFNAYTGWTWVIAMNCVRHSYELLFHLIYFISDLFKMLLFTLFFFLPLLQMYMIFVQSVRV